ncbi:uncharacterized protein LOC121508818 [Cheilinus undulatus]|uniref:uncharacterized protein LOC121508818 n=1 Tax=Cheilinus undulatus TaxID=241271 RepID=UPI001BD3DDEF|nr:uncharacterized protein LOC121508818 [Cheilinus undulatus]
MFGCPEPNLRAHPLGSMARDICPFPDYTPSPLFTNMMSVNSSVNLRNHYTALQSSLSPEQLEDFTRSLRRTFGSEGRVSYGGMGVVALSLAVLFDTLAKQAKGERVPDSGPVPGLFYKNPRGYYPPHVYTVSEFLRLVPYIVNNPDRLKEETERFLKQLKNEDQALVEMINNQSLPVYDMTTVNVFLSSVIGSGTQDLYKLLNGSDSEVLFRSTELPFNGGPTFSFNCDTKKAVPHLLAKAKKSNIPVPGSGGSELLHVAGEDLIYNLHLLQSCTLGTHRSGPMQREDFNLKAGALGKWGE